MNKEPRFFLQHILDSIQRIEEFMQDLDAKNFLKNELVQSAVIRQIEIIGEAAKNLPKEFTNEHKNVPWSEIVGTRDKMIHHYFGVDVALVYDLTKKEIPELKRKIRKILNDL